MGLAAWGEGAVRGCTLRDVREVTTLGPRPRLFLQREGTLFRSVHPSVAVGTRNASAGRRDWFQAL